MPISRRRFVGLAAAGAAVLPAVSRVAWAQAYPSKPVRIVVGFAAGGIGDIVARLIGQWLANRLGQPFVIENRTGAGTNIATEAVVRASPDGYTLLWVTSANAINATLYEKLNFNFIRDIAPVAGTTRLPLVMAVNSSVPARTVPEFIAYAKTNPGRIGFASAGIGSSSHVAGELFKVMAGLDMVHVPYRGSTPAANDLIGGQVQVMFEVASASIEHIRSGRLRGLAVTSATHSNALPDLPTVGDFLQGYEATTWTGIGVPKNTPDDIVDKLNKAINGSLADPKIKARLAELGATAFPSSPTDFGKFVAAETEKWGKVVKFAGVKLN